MKLMNCTSLAAIAAVLALTACGERSQVPMPRADAAQHAAYAPSSLEGRPATAVMGAGPAPSAMPAAQSEATPPAAAQHLSANAAPPPVAVDRMDDQRIVASLRQQYAQDSDISAMIVDVDSKDGMVTLSGMVPSVDARVRADQIARSMKDVRSVNNQIEIKG